MDIDCQITSELKFFQSDDQREAFQAARVEPVLCTETWQFGPEQHSCFIVARDQRTQIVYCETGFGPAFPWSVQAIGERDLGLDSEWHAYLYEAFACSTMWADDLPDDFMHMAPGERQR